MYPQRELRRLAACKSALRIDISLRRAQCAEAASGAARPLAWVDRMVGLFRLLSPLAPLAAIPLGFLTARKVLARFKGLRLLFRLAPIVFGAFRAFKTRAGPHPSVVPRPVKPRGTYRE